MKKLIYLFPVVVTVSVAIAYQGASKPLKPRMSVSSASKTPYLLKRIPASAVHHGHLGAPNRRLFDGASLNWSGYAVPASSGLTFKDVKGSWVVPAVTGTKGSYSYSSAWVGIDGDGTGTVEQIGTEQDWTGRSANYYLWFEMYPNYAYEVTGFLVAAGDHITAEVSYTGTADANGNMIFNLTLNDVTQGQSFTVPSGYNAISGALLESAEWVMEAPSSSRGVLPLADFGVIGFSGCTANGSAMSSFGSLDPMTMVGGTARKSYNKAVPSVVDGTGEGFTVKWYHQ